MKRKTCIIAFWSFVSLMLLIGFLLTLMGNVSAQTSKYTYFELKVKHPQYFSPREVFSIDIEAKNVSGQTFTNGDVIVSFKEKVACEVMTHNATAIQEFPKWSEIYSVEKQRNILSKGLILQVLKYNWRPQQAVHFQLRLTTSSALPLTMLVRVVGKLKGKKELIFEPTSGAKDQQELYVESFLMMSKYHELNADGEVYEHITIPKGIQSQLLFKLSPQTMEQKPRLLGGFDFDSNGTEEVFLKWNKGEYGTIHHYQIYRKKVTGEYVLFSEFEIEAGMAVSGVNFITEPDPKQPRKVIFDIAGGATWGAYYLLRRNGKSADMIASGWKNELIDIDYDGTYEFLLFHRRGGIDIFQWDDISFSYQQKWPEESGKASVVFEILYDVDDDGDKEIVALTDTKEADNQGRKLSIYKLSHGVFTLISQIDVTQPYPAYSIPGIRRLRDRKQIVLLLGKGHRQNAFFFDRHPELPGVRVPVPVEEIVAGYDFKDEHLEFAWLNDQIKIKTKFPSWKGLIPSIDIDGDVQEEMQFEDKETGKPVILKGEKEFSLE